MSKKRKAVDKADLGKNADEFLRLWELISVQEAEIRVAQTRVVGLRAEHRKVKNLLCTVVGQDNLMVVVPVEGDRVVIIEYTHACDDNNIGEERCAYIVNMVKRKGKS